jgi:uncharacterized membrane-anchored protein
VTAQAADGWAAKVPQVTLGFWALKIAATTLGETGGDAVSMSMGWGYLAATALFAALFAALAWAQVRAAGFRPFLYWATIIASTTVGTTLADYATRSLGIGYPGGSLLLLGLLVGSIAWWKRRLGTVSVESVASPASEAHYWLTIACSQTLGTALGDWVADTGGLGYAGGIAIFGGALALVAALHARRALTATAAFWLAFILTRPFGAVLGDFLDKPLADGGLALSRFGASAVLLAAIVIALLWWPQKPARRAH